MITNVFILAVPVVRIFDVGAEAQTARGRKWYNWIFRYACTTRTSQKFFISLTTFGWANVLVWGLKPFNPALAMSLRSSNKNLIKS